MVNLKKKEIKLKEIFREYYGTNVLTSTTVYDLINCYIRSNYKIINNTDYSWCFTPKGYYKYNLIRGLKNNIEGLLYSTPRNEHLKGYQAFNVCHGVKDKDIHMIF